VACPTTHPTTEPATGDSSYLPPTTETNGGGLSDNTPPPDPIEPPTPGSRTRVRKVRVRAPTDVGLPDQGGVTPYVTPRVPRDPNYWNSRLQEHRSSQRLAKAEHYSSLRIA
jgi:hypothetical protein